MWARCHFLFFYLLFVFCHVYVSLNRDVGMKVFFLRKQRYLSYLPLCLQNIKSTPSYMRILFFNLYRWCGPLNTTLICSLYMKSRNWMVRKLRGLREEQSQYGTMGSLKGKIWKMGQWILKAPFPSLFSLLPVY